MIGGVYDKWNHECVEDILGDKRISEYNPRTNTWRKLPDMRYGEHDAICTMDNKIFAIGGYDPLENAEMLDLGDNNVSDWTEIANCGRGHYEPGVAAMDGKIYIVGGEDQSSVVMYDYSSGVNQWRNIGDMSECRMLPGVAVLHGKMYVTGGAAQGLDTGLKTGECYDPVSNKWSSVADMNVARVGHGLVAANGLLFAVGGFEDGNYGYDLMDEAVIDSMEIYDPDTNTWTLLGDTIDGKVAYSGACALIKWDLPNNEINFKEMLL